jgi:hypothetical protein
MPAGIINKFVDEKMGSIYALFFKDCSQRIQPLAGFLGISIFMNVYTSHGIPQ